MLGKNQVTEDGKLEEILKPAISRKASYYSEGYDTCERPTKFRHLPLNRDFEKARIGLLLKGKDENTEKFEYGI